MGSTIRLTVLIAVALLTVARPGAAQTREGLMGDLLRDVTQVEKKMIGDAGGCL